MWFFGDRNDQKCTFTLISLFVSVSIMQIMSIFRANAVKVSIT